VQVDESISNETWLIKIADKKTCANLQTSFDFTVVLPSRYHGNNWQRMNRQVLPVKQFHLDVLHIIAKIPSGFRKASLAHCG
jgi:hypothetical protein